MAVVNDLSRRFVKEFLARASGHCLCPQRTLVFSEKTRPLSKRARRGGIHLIAPRYSVSRCRRLSTTRCRQPPDHLRRLGCEPETGCPYTPHGRSLVARL